MGLSLRDSIRLILWLLYLKIPHMCINYRLVVAKVGSVPALLNMIIRGFLVGGARRVDLALTVIINYIIILYNFCIWGLCNYFLGEELFIAIS